MNKGKIRNPNVLNLFLPGLQSLKLDFHGSQRALDFELICLHSFGLLFLRSSSLFFLQR